MNKRPNSQFAVSRPGFSLVELLITLAIMTAVMFGFAQMVTNNLKAQKGVQDIADLNTFTTLLQQILGVSGACTANFKANPALGNQPVQLNVNDTTSLQATNIEIDYPMPAPSPTPGYVANPANRLIRQGDTYKGWRVSVDSSPNHVNPNPNQGMGVRVLGPAGSSTAYFVEIVVNFQKIVDANGNALSFGSQTAQRQGSTIVVLTSAPDAAGNVTVNSCGSNASEAQTCADFGGTWDASQTPKCKLPGPFKSEDAVCIMGSWLSCPAGWVNRGLGGYIAANSTYGTTCPARNGAAYNSAWTWCHPLICCSK